MPKIRSESPAFDLHHPEAAEVEPVRGHDNPLQEGVQRIFGDAERHPEQYGEGSSPQGNPDTAVRGGEPYLRGDHGHNGHRGSASGNPDPD